jgi:hypothetical protein
MDKTNDYKKFVLDRVERLKKAALIPYFRINVKFVKRISGKGAPPEGYTAAISNADRAYMEADIEVSKLMQKHFQQGHYRYIQEDLAHEIAHIFTDPYYDFLESKLGKRYPNELREMNERQTQKIGMIISKLVAVRKLKRRKKS